LFTDGLVERRGDASVESGICRLAGDLAGDLPPDPAVLCDNLLRGSLPQHGREDDTAILCAFLDLLSRAPGTPRPTPEQPSISRANGGSSAVLHRHVENQRLAPASYTWTCAYGLGPVPGGHLDGAHPGRNESASWHSLVRRSKNRRTTTTCLWHCRRYVRPAGSWATSGWTRG